MDLGLWVAIGFLSLLLLLALCICCARYFLCLPCLVARSSEETTQETPRTEEPHGEESNVSGQESNAAGESNADQETPNEGAESSPVADPSEAAESSPVAEPSEAAESSPVGEPSEAGQSSADYDVPILTELIHVAQILPLAEGVGAKPAE